MKIINSFLIILLASSAHGQTERPILFPVFSAAPQVGVGGTTYTTFLSYFATRPVFAEPVEGVAQTLPAGLASLRIHRNSVKGRVLWIDDPDAVSFGYVLTSSVEGGDLWRTQLPVVRDRDFLTGPARLLNSKLRRPTYPVEGAVFRNTLRIYDLDAEGGRRFIVRVYVPSNGASLVAEDVVVANGREGADRTYPFFSEIDLNRLFSRDFCFPFSRRSPCVDLDFMVEVMPVTGTSRYYAFLTLTHEITQQVTVITPQ